MAIYENKTGRPRRYDFEPSPEIPNHEAALYVSALNELSERVYDQVVHLPQDVIDFMPENTNLSIGRLLVHLGWADVRMFGIAMGKQADPETQKILEPGSLKHFSSTPESFGSAASLVDFLRKIRRSFVIPWCAEIEDIHQLVKEKGPLDTVEKVFMHMCYHWTFHSGHIGLLSFQAGYDYTWTFAE